MPTSRSPMSRAPRIVGTTTNIRKMKPKRINHTAGIAANMMTAFITISVAARAKRRHFSRANVSLGRSRDPRLGGPGGSPFQLPARLADGLGPESDRDNGSRHRSPHPRFLEELVP